MYSVYITPVAETDLIEASLWYSFQKDGLEKEFFICVEAAINWVRRDPLLFEKLDETQVRKVNTQKFPYGIYFYVEGNEINILAILHLRDNPGRWKSREF